MFRNIRSHEPKLERGQGESVYIKPSLKRASQKEAARLSMSWSAYVSEAVREKLERKT